MQEFILHIGVHTTGTSSVHNTPYKFDNRDISYAQPEKNHHFVTMYRIKE